MGCGEAVLSSVGIAWPGEYGLNNAKPGLGGRQSRPGNPSEAKTPEEALSYIERLYKSGHTEDVAKLLRRSQVFRTAWLILQQSSPEVSETAGAAKGSSCRNKPQGPAGLPVPASGPLSLTLRPEPELPGPEVGKTESSPQIPAAVMVADGGKNFFAPGSPAARPLTLLLRAYLNQDGYGAREKQRGQLVSIRA
jgi:hypothetical protein